MATEYEYRWFIYSLPVRIRQDSNNIQIDRCMTVLTKYVYMNTHTCANTLYPRNNIEILVASVTPRR